MIDGALQIKHGLQLLERSENAIGDIRVADTHHPAAHRAEDRLDDHIAHVERGSHGLVDAFADNRVGDLEARLLKKRGRVELVH